MSTFHSISFHIVFSTKHRTPWIKESWQERLHGYLGGCLRTLDTKPLKIGGVEDHVHLLVGCKPTHCVCDVVREIKSKATSWVHEEIGYPPFCWQSGYSVFSVSPDARADVTRYIANQAEHHRRRTFKEELMSMLEAAEIEYDPEYLE